jgi:hypothetical protein
VVQGVDHPATFFERDPQDLAEILDQRPLWCRHFLSFLGVGDRRVVTRVRRLDPAPLTACVHRHHLKHGSMPVELPSVAVRQRDRPDERVFLPVDPPEYRHVLHTFDRKLFQCGQHFFVGREVPLRVKPFLLSFEQNTLVPVLRVGLEPFMALWLADAYRGERAADLDFVEGLAQAEGGEAIEDVPGRDGLGRAIAADRLGRRRAVSASGPPGQTSVTMVSVADVVVLRAMVAVLSDLGLKIEQQPAADGRERLVAKSGGGRGARIGRAQRRDSQEPDPALPRRFGRG